MTDNMIEHDETSDLIASDKVEGTTVYDRDGEKLGTIYNFMVDKHSGQFDYAVLSFGGLFGLGSDYYPIPWDLLAFDKERGGYVVDIDKETLEDAPRYAANEEPAFNRTYADEVYGYYGVTFPVA